MSHLLYNPQNENLITHAQLADYPTPPSQGRFHRPVPFAAYIDEVKEALDRNGLRSIQDEFALSKDNNKLFGVMEVEPLEGQLITSDEWKLLVGVRGAHDQSISRGLTLGSSVMVCSNLCFSGDLGTFTTKQTTHIWDRLPRLIYDAVARIPEMATRQEKSFQSYQDHTMGHRTGDAALMELVRRGALTGAQVVRAMEEWDNPTHEDHGRHGDSIWKLFNASTEALKPTGANVNHHTIQDRTLKVSGFMDELVTKFSKAA